MYIYINVVTEYMYTDANISKNRINTHQDETQHQMAAHVYIHTFQYGQEYIGDVNKCPQNNKPKQSECDVSRMQDGGRTPFWKMLLLLLLLLLVLLLLMVNDDAPKDQRNHIGLPARQ